MLSASCARSRPALFALACLGVISLVVLVGCGDDDNPANPGGGTPASTNMYGTFAGGTIGGKLTISIAATALAPPRPSTGIRTHLVTATGSMDLDGGGVIQLGGTYNDETDTLKISGGGYTFIGTYDATGTVPGILGGFTGPDQGFFGCVTGTASSVKVFCGTFVNAGVTVDGRWNILIVGDELAGLAVVTGSSGVVGLEGTITGTGNPRQITIELVSSDDIVADSQLSADGTWDTTTNEVSGTWTLYDSTPTQIDNGTWTGGLCQ